MALNIFGQPPEYLSGLLGVDPEKLRKQATTTGLINTALAFAAQPRNQQYGSVLPYAARALMAGQQGAQGVYQGALQDFQTKQKIEEIKRQQEQNTRRQSAIQKFGVDNPMLQAAAEAFPEQVIPQAALKSLETVKPEYKVVDGQVVKIDNGTATSIFGGEDGQPKIKLAGTEAIEAKTLFPNNPNPSTWDANQLDIWNKYQTLPSEAEHTRLKQDAENTFYNTGQRVSVPPSKNQFLRSLGSGGATPQQSTARNPNQIRQVVSTPTPQQPAAATRIQEPAFEQQQPLIAKVPPKQRENLLLEQPQATATLRSVGSKIDELDKAIVDLLDNKKGLKNVTGLAGSVPIVPGSDRANALAALESITTRIGLNTLQEMRDSSKTGGAVGQVTEKEWPRLEAALGSLSRSQSYDQFVTNLQNIQNIIRETKGRASQKYYETYGSETAEESINNLSPAGQNAFQKHYQR